MRHEFLVQPDIHVPPPPPPQAILDSIVTVNRIFWLWFQQLNIYPETKKPWRAELLLSYTVVLQIWRLEFDLQNTSPRLPVPPLLLKASMTAHICNPGIEEKADSGGSLVS